MTTLGLGIGDLIDRLLSEHDDATDLEQLSEAQYQAFVLKNLGDQLIGFFVSKARDSGASWAQIGDALGVSRQAAQQRWLPTIFERFNIDARQIVVDAENFVIANRHEAVGPEHLMLAAIDRPDAGAAKVLSALGIADGTVQNELRHVLVPGSQTPFLQGLFTAQGKEVIRQANRESKDLGHEFVGSEHILLAALALNKHLSSLLAGCGLHYHGVRTQVAKNVARTPPAHVSSEVFASES